MADDDELRVRRLTPMPWSLDALCNGMELETFYPPPGVNPRDAQVVCAKCPVVIECLAWALENNEEHGIWGGASYVARQQMKRGDLTISEHFEWLAKRKPSKNRGAA